MMVKCMRCRKLLPESKMHKLMRFQSITPGANLGQIRAEFQYIIANNIGKRFFGYMCNDCWGNKGRKPRMKLIRKLFW
jgi:hypothetical protein